MNDEGKLYFIVTVDVDAEVEEGASPRYAGVYEVEHERVLESPELAAIRGFGEFAKRTHNHQRFWFRGIHEDG